MIQTLSRIMKDRMIQTLILMTALVCAWFAYETSVLALEISRKLVCEIESQQVCDDLDNLIRSRAILPVPGLVQ